ncbi:heparinase II/III family protein [Paenibacillus sp. strain BS8-2]
MSMTKMQDHKQDWRQQVIDTLRAELDQALEAGGSIPKEPGGWWHQYVCPHHHTELLYHELMEDNGKYHCPHGCVMEGEPYHGAWLVYRHQSMARHALKAAAVYAETQQFEYGAFGRAIIVNYAKQFPIYPVHPDAQPWMLKGRAFHQALTEAIWATTLLKAYMLLLDAGMDFGESEADITLFVSMLGSSMEQYHEILTIDRAQPENNYTAWLNAALSCIYGVKQDEAKLITLLEQEGGFKHHMEIAIQGDGLEFEGSVYYHVFVLRAYLITASVLERFGMDGYAIRAEGNRHIEGMLDVLAQLADEQGRLPAFHDGPYDRLPYTLELIEVFEQGYAKYKKTEYWNILDYYYGMLGHYKAGNAGLEALLYRKHVSVQGELEQVRRKPSVLLADSGFAVLRQAHNPISAIIDFGPHGGAHGHYDKLNLMLSLNDRAISPDRGTVPYGSPLKKGWYPSTASHNTVSVNGRSQQETAGQCMAFHDCEEFSSITTCSNDAYTGATLVRHVLTNESCVIDWFQITMAEQGQVDWWFHFLGRPELEEWCMLPEPELIGHQDGYEHIRAVSKWASKGSPQTLRIVTGECDAEDITISAAIIVPDHGQAYIVESPGVATDPSQPMKGLLVRTLDTHMDLIAVYHAGEEKVEIRQETLIGKDGTANRKLIVEAGGAKTGYAVTAEGIREMSE